MKYFFCALGLLSLLTGCGKNISPQSSIEVATKGFYSAALANDGRSATIGSIHHGGSFWRLEDGERLFNWNHEQGDVTTIVASDFSDDDNWAITAAAHTMVLWNTLTGRGERFWTAPAEILDVELNRQGTLALLGLEDHTAVIFDIRRGGIRRVFNHQNRVRSVDFSADGTLAITGSEDYTATIWDTESGEVLKKIRHEDDVQLVALSDDGSLALSVSKYDKAVIWQTNTAEIVGEVPLNSERLKRGMRFTAARFSSDNKYLLTGRPDQIVQLWSVDELHEIARWKLPKRSMWKPTSVAVVDVEFGEISGSFVVAASNGYIHHLELPNTSTPPN